MICSSAGDFVRQVITCPNCDKKLALREELKGRALICPQCKGRFTAPSDEPQMEVSVFDTTSNEASSANDSAMDFLDSLGSSPNPAAGKTTAKNSTSTRPATASRASIADAASPTASGASRAAASRARKKNDQRMFFYIGGGVMAAVLVVVLVAIAALSDNVKQKNENIRFGLTDSIRHQLFSKMILAVDEHGISKDCKEEWFRLADEYRLDRNHVKDVLDEGFDRKDWDQPQLVVTMDQKQKHNRQEWIATRNETKRDPVMAQ